MRAWYTLVLLMALFTFIAALGAYYFKRAAENFSLHPLKLIKNHFFIIAGTLYTSATVAYVYLLQTEQLIVLYPLGSLQYVWVALLSATLLKETITTKKIIGMTFIIIGVIIISVLA